MDANSLIYHFTNEPRFGAACTQLVKRVEQRQLEGFISTHALADVAHRLMTLEAVQLFSWPSAGIAARLRKHHDEIPRLQVYQEAIARIPLVLIQVIPITQALLQSATLLSQQHELLTGDALIVAAMRANGLTNLASNDADFDRVPDIIRYAPI
ncbi:MAG TPA: PIN domain-containing protein [Pirellulales bacterium]|nr:PIN domain-containing protein [Pirellulales bacterium]